MQYWNKQRVEFPASELPIDRSLLLAPINKSESEITFGEFTVRLELPLTVSPKVKVLIWYTRSDGEVIAHHHTINVAKCLKNKVDLSWSEDRAEQGSQASLVLSAEPQSLCSLGVVDKSVALLANSQEALTLEKVFEIAEVTFAGDYDNWPIDDNEYCREMQEAADNAEALAHAEALLNANLTTL